MIEGVPNPESSEAVTRESVVESLKQDFKDLSFLNKFLDKRESEVTTSKEALALSIETAEIYKEAGMLDEAYEAFLDARDQARQEGDDELADRLFSEAEKLVIE